MTGRSRGFSFVVFVEVNTLTTVLSQDHAIKGKKVFVKKMQLDEQARVVVERGMVLIGNKEEDEDAAAFDAKTSDEEQEKRTKAAVVSAERNTILSGLGLGPLDVRINRLAEERDDLQAGNALARVQRVHEPADLWDITFCTR